MTKVRIARRKILVSILIPILLLSGLLVFPVSAASSWSKPRPSSNTDYYDTIGNAFTNGIASVGMGVHIFHYHETGAPDDNDYLRFRVSVSANTRKGVYYDVQQWSYNWYEVSDPTGITGDDAGVNLTLPFTVLYYGVEYNYVWVSSNGFLSFDCPSTSPTPESIPNTNKPNSTVAVFWRDLNPAAGGSITYGYIFQTPPLFVISWNNVPNKGNGIPQTFQVVIRGRQGWGSTDFHNEIIFQYNSITKDYPTAVGVEDQVGDKGTSYDYNNLHNGLGLKFKYPDRGYRPEQLKIRLTKLTVTQS